MMAATVMGSLATMDQLSEPQGAVPTAYSRTFSISDLVHFGKKETVVEQIESKQREALNKKLKDLQLSTGRVHKERRVRMPTLALSKGALNLPLPKAKPRSGFVYQPVTPAFLMPKCQASTGMPCFSNKEGGSEFSRRTFRSSKSWSNLSKPASNNLEESKDYGDTKSNNGRNKAASNSADMELDETKESKSSLIHSCPLFSSNTLAIEEPKQIYSTQSRIVPKQPTDYFQEAKKEVGIIDRPISKAIKMPKPSVPLKPSFETLDKSKLQCSSRSTSCNNLDNRLSSMEITTIETPQTNLEKLLQTSHPLTSKPTNIESEFKPVDVDILPHLSGISFTLEPTSTKVNSLSQKNFSNSHGLHSSFETNQDKIYAKLETESENKPLEIQYPAVLTSYTNRNQQSHFLSASRPLAFQTLLNIDTTSKSVTHGRYSSRVNVLNSDYATNADESKYTRARPKTSQVSPSPSVSAPKASHASSATSFTAPETSHASPSTYISAPEISHVSPSTSFSALETGYVSPSTSISALETSHISPSTSVFEPETSHISHSTYVFAPKTSHASSSISFSTHEISHISPSPSLSALEISHVSPSPSLSALEISHGSPSTSIFAVETSHVSPSMPASEPETSHVGCWHRQMDSIVSDCNTIDSGFGKSESNTIGSPCFGSSDELEIHTGDEREHDEYISRSKSLLEFLDEPKVWTSKETEYNLHYPVISYNFENGNSVTVEEQPSISKTTLKLIQVCKNEEEATKKAFTVEKYLPHSLVFDGKHQQEEGQDPRTYDYVDEPSQFEISPRMDGVDIKSNLTSQSKRTKPFQYVLGGEQYSTVENSCEAPCKKHSEQLSISGIQPARSIYPATKTSNNAKIEDQVLLENDKSKNVKNQNKSDALLIEVELIKGPFGLGFCIEGGIGSPAGNKPITVKRLFKGETAAQGILEAGDELVSVNGQPFKSFSHFQAWNHLKCLPEGPIKLQLIRKK